MASDPAAARYLLLALVRLSGSAIIVLGVILLAGGIGAIDPAHARIAGVICVIIGMLEMTILIPLLARRWRSPPP